MGEVVIKVENLSKRYQIGERERYRALRDILAGSVTAPVKRLFGNNGKRKNTTEEPHIWALKDVSFEVKRGDVVGIIGRNGAGKSTLLKILSRITRPTSGYAEINGRVGSLLEVGTGFHPELTGRENIYLNGAVLGMRKVEIRKKFDEIVDFAEVERFLDTPVKRYSSGMYVRLAFAVAAHLEPEILMVDEVLAVGDAQFQKKCLGKMGDVAKEGRTVLFVSHNMSTIRKLCQRTILLKNGCIVKEGRSEEVISKYLSLVEHAKQGQISWFESNNAPGDKELQVRAVRFRNDKGIITASFQTEEDIFVEIAYQVIRPLRNARVGFRLLTIDGTVILSSGDGDNAENAINHSPGYYQSRCKIPGGLLNAGNYIIQLSGHIPGIKHFFTKDTWLSFEVAQTNDIGGYGQRPGIIRPLLEWRSKMVGNECQDRKEF